MRGHPIRTFLVVSVIGFLLVAGATLLLGWALQTYALHQHGLGRADERANVWLAAHRTGARNSLSYWLSGIGDVYAIPALVGVTCVAAAVLRRWRVAGFVLGVIAIEAATYRVATLVIDRPRPRVPRLDDLPVNDSFYSGHTAASVAVYCGLALLITSRIRNPAVRALTWTMAIAIPLLVGLARMYRGMHHPTDVAAGLLIGLGCLIVALTAARSSTAARRGETAT
jgi:undecaprenyl-diphosphatase